MVVSSKPDVDARKLKPDDPMTIPFDRVHHHTRNSPTDAPLVPPPPHLYADILSPRFPVGSPQQMRNHLLDESNPNLLVLDLVESFQQLREIAADGIGEDHDQEEDHPSEGTSPLRDKLSTVLWMLEEFGRGRDGEQGPKIQVKKREHWPEEWATESDYGGCSDSDSEEEGEKPGGGGEGRVSEQENEDDAAGAATAPAARIPRQQMSVPQSSKWDCRWAGSKLCKADWAAVEDEMSSTFAAVLDLSEDEFHLRSSPEMSGGGDEFFAEGIMAAGTRSGREDYCRRLAQGVTYLVEFFAEGMMGCGSHIGSGEERHPLHCLLAEAKGSGRSGSSGKDGVVSSDNAASSETSFSVHAKVACAKTASSKNYRAPSDSSSLPENKASESKSSRAKNPNCTFPRSDLRFPRSDFRCPVRPDHPPDWDGKDLCWQAQVLIRPPDADKAADGPCWHIDEWFYWVHGTMTLVGPTTKAVEVGDEVMGDKSGPENCQTPPPGEQDGSSFSSQSTTPCSHGSRRDRSTPSAIASPDAVNQEESGGDNTPNDTVLNAASTQNSQQSTISPVRRLALLEHHPGPTRRAHKTRFFEKPKLTKDEVTRVIDPRRAKDFIFYTGGETARGWEATKRGAIHQGPHVTKDFKETGRVSLFFAVFNFS